MKFRTASIITLGCRLNQADSALMAGRLEKAGIKVLPLQPGTDPDIIILNSCAVTATASRKSRQTLRALKEKHPLSAIVFTGCSATAEGADAEAGAISGIFLDNEGKKSLIPALEGNATAAEAPCDGGVFSENAFSVFHERHRANLKIQEGCNNFCSYCIVPYTRGRERSRELKETLDDLKRLSDAGFSEIVLTGINTCHYSSNGTDLPRLLEMMLEQGGSFRIRIGSTEPGGTLMRIIDAMAASGGRICEFLHPSIQHGSDTILRAMNRHYLTEEYAGFVEYARSKVPGIHIGTDVIAGFPGETDALFEESIAFLEKMHFANMHIFPFSPREGTKAFSMSGLPHGTAVAERLERLRELKEKSACAFRDSLTGAVQEVLAEKTGSGCCTGWTGSYIRAKVEGAGVFVPGSLVKCKVIGNGPDGILLCKKQD